MASCLVMVTLGCTPSATAPGAPSPASPAARHLDQAIEVVRTNALFRDSVDWAAIRAQAFERIAHPPTTTYAAYPAIRFVLRSLGDNHSFLQLSDSLEALEARYVAVPGAGQSEQVHRPSPYGTRMQPDARRLSAGDRSVGFVFMPQGRRTDAFATRFAAMIDSVATPGVCGWVVDLRGNGGGNMWPMLAGIGSLLGEGEVGGWVFADGGSERYFYRNGRGIVRDTTGAELVRATATDPPPPLSPDVPIAVLIDRGTASSGEVMAVAFRGRANTRFFGEPTYGATTATEGFQLSDGANLVLAVATLTDKQGRGYLSSVRPDVHVPSGSTQPALEDDAGVRQALSWLQTTPPCR